MQAKAHQTRSVPANALRVALERVQAKTRAGTPNHRRQRQVQPAESLVSIHPSVREALASPGRSLEKETRAVMERRFGCDFGRVRVHDGAAAAESARTMAAHAYTVGQHIVFASGAYAPASQTGRRLLAHELAHTVQQQGIQRSPLDGSMPLAADNARLEQEADRATAIDGAGARRITRVRRPMLQRQANPATAYDIQLTYPPNHSETHHALSLPDALAVLRRFANRVDGYIEGGYEGLRYLHRIHDDQYIVAGVSDFFGGRSIPSLGIWTIPRVLLRTARAAIDRGEVATATRIIQMAAQATHAADREVYAYREGTIAGAERAVFGLQVLEVAGAAAATVLTAGSSTLVTVGVGATYAGAQRLAGEASSVAFGLQSEIDWASIAFDTLFAAIGGGLGGFAGPRIAAALGGRITARVASSLIVGRASGILNAVAREVFERLRGRGEPLTVGRFWDLAISQLTVRAAFLDLVGHAVGSVGQRAQSRQSTEPTPSSRLSGPQRQPLQGGNREPVEIRNGLVVSRARSSRGGGTTSARAQSQPAIRSQARGNVALATAEPSVQPVIEPVVPRHLQAVPEAAPQSLPETTPQANARTRPTSSFSPVSAGVAIAAGQQNQPRRSRRRNKPTGLTQQPDDLIPMIWYKHLSYYPSPIFLEGHPYEMEEQTRLPRGHEIGVNHYFLPEVGKHVQLYPEDRNPNIVRQFRDTLTSYGFYWEPYEADHVQDVEWGGEDRPANLWPMQAGPNGRAGPVQNQNQRVTYYPTYDSPTPLSNIRIEAAKALPASDNILGRHFKITTVRRLP